MDNEKKNRYIVITVIVILLLLVVGFIVYAIINNDKKNNSLIDLSVNQIYSSDYNLISLGDEYYIGYYDDNTINVIIDNTGKEIFKAIDLVTYDGIYLMKDGNYLIYSNKNNKLVTYVFDGENVEKFYEIDDVSYVKPLIYKGIDREYIIGFSSIVEDDLYFYGLNNSSVLVVSDTILIADYNVNGIYYTYNENYFVVKNSDGLMGVIDFDGNVIIDYDYLDIINTYDESFIVKNSKGKYGILDITGDTLIDFKYKVIDYYRDYYLLVNSSNKMAIYGNDYQKITKFDMKYDSLIEYDLRNEHNSINSYRVNGNIIVLNNYLEGKNGIEYDNHLLYYVKDGVVDKTIKQIGFDNNDVLYTYDKEHNVFIYDMYFQPLFDFQVDDLTKVDKVHYVSNDIIRFSYVDTKENVVVKYFDLEGNEVDFGLGDLAIKNVDYYAYFKEEGDNKKMTFYDVEGNYLDEVLGKSIKINNDYLIVDNSIYKIEIES